MAEDITLEYGVLNITCNPHPEGIYRKLLEKVAETHINFRGEDYAAISKPERAEGGYYVGQLFIWTLLNPDDPAIDTKKLEEVTLEQANIFLPPDYGINGKTFVYVLREHDHRIFFEVKNDVGHSFAPKTFQHIMDRLFVPTNLDRQLEVTVSVQNDLDILEQILNLPVLKVLEIHVIPPNPDENDPDAEKVLKRLDRLNAKAKTTKLEKKSGRSTLKMDDQILSEVRVAGSGSGYVMAKGLDAKKRKAELKTADHPLKITKKVSLVGGLSAIGHAVRTAKDTVVGKRR